MYLEYGVNDKRYREGFRVELMEFDTAIQARFYLQTLLMDNKLSHNCKIYLESKEIKFEDLFR